MSTNTTITSTESVQFAVPETLTPEQAEAGEHNPILPGEKIGVTFTVMAVGKPWPTTSSASRSPMKVDS